MTTKESILLKNDSILKIEIDNLWSSNDFANLFNTMNRLYGYTLHLIKSLESLEMMEKEYNWGDNYHNLPNYVNLSTDFKQTALEILQNPNLNDYISGRYEFIITSVPPLFVKKINYGSKGSVDFLGIGKIFEIIKELIINYIPNDNQKMDKIIKEKEIEEREQKILQMKIRNLKKLGLNSNEILTIIGFESFHLNKIKELISNDKINELQIEKHSGK